MIQSLESTIWRFRKPRSIDQVLKRFISPSKVRAIQKKVGDSTLLLDEVATSENLSRKGLYEKVAELLKCSSLQQVKCPSSAALAEFGLSVAELKLKGCVPQNGIKGGARKIAASDLSIMSSDYFIKGNYELQLAPVSEIEKVLLHIENAQSIQAQGRSIEGENSFSLPQMQSVVTQLAIDAQSLNAKEVLIGVPSINSYEFVVGDEHYSGKLHPGVCERLINWLSGKRNVRIKTDLHNFEVLKLSLLNEGRDRVVFLAWGADSLQEKNRENQQIETVEKVSIEKVPNKKLALPDLENASKGPVASQVKSKVLLVEDDERYAKLLSGLLNKNGFTVTHFVDANDALDSFSKELPELIISDIHLPTINGDEFTKKIRAKSDAVPVLVLTSDDRTLLEAELVDIGANAFLRKDEDIRVILSWCKNLAKKSADKKSVNWN